MTSPLAGLALAASITCGLASAQQFQLSPTPLPGGNVWSEGVCAADIDRDGDMDILIANGDGFASAGPKRQNVVILNLQVEQGPGIFAEESVARLGVNLSNAKSVIAGDVNGDGWPDLLYSNAFNTDPPFLYINRGAAQPGFFDLESASRGLTEVLSSACAQFGDLDDDGDLDIVMCDSGTSFLFGAGAAPKLYINDGTGHFTDASPQLNAPVMVAQMDVHLVDMDRDFDLDIVITNRGSSHYLLLNDGTANFSNASNLLPTTGMPYEAEVSDLDRDGDVDFFFLSRSGFNEAAVRNDLVETGTLGFTNRPTLPGGQDDNEIGLIDHDMDGDLDVFVGSLGSRERVYRNDGGMNFALANGVIQSFGDSTLDLAVADFDGDGDADVVTVQGESGGFANRLYLNQGPADNRPPRAEATDVPARFGGPEIVAHAKFQDQLMDDGEDFLAVEAAYLRVRPEVEIVDLTSSGFVPATVTVPQGSRIRFRSSLTQSTFLAADGPTSWQREVPAGGEIERVFMATGDQSLTYAVFGFPLLVTVTGTSATVAATDSGNGLYRAVVPALPMDGPTADVAVAFRATDDAGNVGWSDVALVRDLSALGTNYCAALPNTSGVPGVIVARGRDILGAQTLILEGHALPINQFGIFIASQNPGAAPLAQGILCLDAPFVRFNDVLDSGPAGMVSMPVDFGALPFGANFAVGDTWHFSYWFRDTDVPNGANLTDGVRFEWR